MMSSDEDFSLVTPESELQKIRNEISKCQRTYDVILNDQKMLADSRDNNLHFAKEFDQRCTNMKAALRAEQQTQEQMLEVEQRKVAALLDDQQSLRTQIQRAQEDIQQLEKTNQRLQQQSDVSTAVPERKVIFKGDTSDARDTSGCFDINPKVVYPMEGGTALITFEEEAVAQNVLKHKDHDVELEGGVTLSVQALPVHLMMPSYVELDTQVCPHRVLVSNLPKMESVERLLDKLELHFSKKKNGGGEVEETDMLPDSGNVVITFVENNIAKGLTDKQDHEVEAERGKRHKVKVTPFLNGKIADIQTRETVCQRSVLLTGIPSIMDQESLEDQLEIHFQKTCNGGGEVDDIIYNPVGQTTLAEFDGDSGATE